MHPALLRGALTSALLAAGAGALADAPSTCYGTTANGRLENGWRLPRQGENFRSYSTVLSMLGRTYVHSAVHAVVLDAYAQVHAASPDVIYVYGETGRKSGGEFEPHKTHRNGLSVDFMVPVRDANGASVPLPTGVRNKWGYELEFDANGKLGELTIDFAAIAEHLYQLHKAADAQGIGLWRVIFDPKLQPLLQTSPRWPYLAANVQFSTRRSWVRHDDHYHVDFAVPCKDFDAK